MAVSDGEWRVVCIFHEVADEFCGVVSRAASGLEDARDKVDVWISVKINPLSSLGHVTWAGAGCSNESRAAGEGCHKSNIKVRGGAVVIKNEVNARMFDLTVHLTSEGWNRLLNVHLSAIV